MSEQTAEVTTDAQGSEVVELPPQDDAAFSALMDALAPEADDPPEAASGETADPPDAEGGQPAPAGEGAADPGADPATPTAGDGGEPVVAGEPAAAPVATAPVVPPDTRSTPVAGDLSEQFGKVSLGIETRVKDAFERTAMSEIQAEFPKYIEAIQKHPRLLVGTEVQSLQGEGMEVLRDSQDAKEWQDAARTLLAQEVADRRDRAIEDSSGYLDTLHQSIELFQNNADLVPGTKGFDKDLADAFAKTAQPYEVKVEGKLHGYTIPVQPLINQLRTQLAADRAATAATAAPAASAKGPAGEKQAVPADPPQAGIASKAGDSSNKEDFSTLFGTIGLPNLRI